MRNRWDANSRRWLLLICATLESALQKDFCMSIQDYAELLALKEVGRIVQLAISAMANSVREGISTRELADIGGQVMRQNGPRSAPALGYSFPGDLLIRPNAQLFY